VLGDSFGGLDGRLVEKIMAVSAQKKIPAKARQGRSDHQTNPFFNKVSKQEKQGKESLSRPRVSGRDGTVLRVRLGPAEGKRNNAPPITNNIVKKTRKEVEEAKLAPGLVPTREGPGQLVRASDNVIKTDRKCYRIKEAPAERSYTENW